MSSDDSDLIDIEYNTDLKHYVLGNLRQIKKIIFTSTLGKNSAYETFKKIMGPDIQATLDKLVTGLPSPSGARRRAGLRQAQISMNLLLLKHLNI